MDLKRFSAVFASVLSLIAAADKCTAEGVCVLPGTSGKTHGVYNVLSPVGSSSVKMIKQAPRLTTLHHKTIAIVGGSFMAHITHPELKRLILAEYPTAKVLVLNEIGSAGPWPGPGVIRKSKDEFVSKLKKLKVDAVISGNGGCGLCTPKEMGSCIAAEYTGIPSVMIAAPGFTRQAINAARISGVPAPRIAEYPGAFSSHTTDELKANTRKVLYPQIKKALTTALESKEYPSLRETDSKSIVFSGTFEEVNRYFADNNWSDGLPIVPPTPEQVEYFLKFTDLAPDSVISAIPPSYRKITPRIIAVNAVMSGCPAEFMPILIAFTKAMSDGNFRRTLSSTHAWTPYCWVNGPISRQLGIDNEQGEISSQRNACIGRYINLAMLNIGGYYIKQNRMGTFGYLMPWCLAEDEKTAIAIKWLPYHMQMGYNLNDNTITAASALNWGNNMSPATADPQKIMELMAQDAVEKQQFAIGSGTPFVYRTMLITGNVARDLAKKYQTKNQLEDALLATARQPVQARAYANYYANPGSAFNPDTYFLYRHESKISRIEGGKNTAPPEWLKWTGIKNIETVPVMKSGKTALLITGDTNRNKTMCVPGGGYATIKIELPANWDKLTRELGYAPLASFYLRSDLAPEKNPRVFRNYRQRRQ